MLFISDSFVSIFSDIGFKPEQVFTDPAIKPWRTLPDRENCVWEIPGPTGSLRLHVKRFPATRASKSDAEIEAAGYQLLRTTRIPTADLVSVAKVDDGRSFIITQDLAGYIPADKLIESGDSFDSILFPTADLAAKLHASGLHHRDLYLCHFLVISKQGGGAGIDHESDLRLIDAARVRPFPGPFTRRRWIVKDLAQFWYSTLALPISDEQRTNWLERYAQKTGITSIDRLHNAIQRKAKAIGSHDDKLRRKQPNRNISIPNR
jgi:hypothetical protein